VSGFLREEYIFTTERLFVVAIIFFTRNLTLCAPNTNILHHFPTVLLQNTYISFMMADFAGEDLFVQKCCEKILLLQGANEELPS
jgi:hypothetical protein